MSSIVAVAAPIAASPTSLRFVSAASLFDGHDAAMNLIRRLPQAAGAEVVHLGRNGSVADIVRTAIDERHPVFRVAGERLPEGR